MKRRGNSMVDRDRVIAVEAQDRELARMLQEKVYHHFSNAETWLIRKLAHN
jgi:hypothetical protein